MAFEVSGRVVAPAIVLRLDVDHDLGPCVLGPGVCASTSSTTT
jgi:hypothetical protein